MSLSEFAKYYQCAFKLPDSVFEVFMRSVSTPLPYTFRVTNTPDCNIITERLKKYSFIRKFAPLEKVYTFGPSDSSEDYREFKDFLVAQSDIGNIQRQEVVSMLPHLFLGVKPDHTVLETCAAPGSKTKQFLEVVKSGLVVSNDKSPARTNVLVSEASKKAFTGFIAMHSDAIQLPTPHILFDRICCDVPCSSDGTVRKNQAVQNNWSIKSALGLVRLQTAILLRSLDFLKDGGILTYSTCSFNPIENEYVVSKALETGEYELCSEEDTFGFAEFISHNELESGAISSDKFIFRRGQTKFNLHQVLDESGFLNGEHSDWMHKKMEFIKNIHFDNPELSKCVKVFPQDRNTGGFFVAVLRRKAGKTRCDGKCKQNQNQLRKKMFYEVPEDILKEIATNHNIDPNNKVFLSTGSNYRNIYCVSTQAHEFIMNNLGFNIVYAGIKSFVKTDIGDCAYRAKSAFMEHTDMPVDFTGTVEDFNFLLENRTVPMAQLSFKPAGHFTVSFTGLPYKFSGFAGRDTVFLYIDKQKRNALRLLYSPNK